MSIGKNLSVSPPAVKPCMRTFVAHGLAVTATATTDCKLQNENLKFAICNYYSVGVLPGDKLILNWYRLPTGIAKRMPLDAIGTQLSFGCLHMSPASQSTISEVKVSLKFLSLLGLRYILLDVTPTPLGKLTGHCELSFLPI